MDFDFIKQFHRNPPLAKLPRNECVEEEYQNAEKQDLRAEFFTGKNEWSLTTNKYPYNFTDNTKHYLLWFRDDKVDYSLVEELFIVYEIGEEVVFFENLENNRSIKGIRHIHIFVK